MQDYVGTSSAAGERLPRRIGPADIRNAHEEKIQCFDVSSGYRQNNNTRAWPTRDGRARWGPKESEGRPQEIAGNRVEGARPTGRGHETTRARKQQSAAGKA
eukprot:9484236-Pyramimonas_sp.AAC.1